MNCWFITGSYLAKNTTNDICSIFVEGTDSHHEIEGQLKKFWKIEEIVQENPFTNEELFCEEHFQMTIMREDDGRVVVSIPFKDSMKKLDMSRANDFILWKKGLNWILNWKKNI